MCNLCFLCHCTLALCVCVCCMCVRVCVCVHDVLNMCVHMCMCVCVCVGGYILVFQCIDHFRLQLMFFGNWFSGLRVGVQHCQPLSAQSFRNGCTQ